MNKLLTIYVFLFWGSIVFSQEFATDSIVVSTSHSEDWTVYVNELDFQIEYKFVQCDPSMGYDKEMVIFRFTNTTGNEITLNWHMEMYRGKECTTCPYPDEYTYEISVRPNSTIEGDCSIYGNNQMRVFSHFIDANYTGNAQPLAAFRFAHLTLVQ